MLGALEAGLSGLGGPRWGGAADWPVGTGRNRAALRAVAPLPSRGVRPGGVVAPADPAAGEDGAVTGTRAREPRSQSGSAVPGTEEVVAGTLDLCPCRWRGADEQCGRTCATARRTVAQGVFRVG